MAKAEVQLIMEANDITKLLMNYLKKYDLDNVETALWEKYFTLLNENETGMWFYGPVDLKDWLEQEYHELIVVGPDDEDYNAFKGGKEEIGTIEAEVNNHYLIRY